MLLRRLGISISLLFICAGLFLPSYAAPGDVLYSNNFNSSADENDWSVTLKPGGQPNDFVVISAPQNSISGNTALRIRDGLIIAESANPIDLSLVPYASVSFWLKQPSGGNEPDAGDTLTFEYLDNSGNWIPLQSFDGADPGGTTYTPSINLPPSAFHSNLRFRFYLVGAGNDNQWFIDDFSVTEVAGPPITGLIGEWQLDENLWTGTLGEVLDNSGNGLNATAYNGAFNDDANPAIAGNPGTCRYGVFNGSNQYLEVADSPLLDIADNLTITVWINTNSIPSSGLKSILSKDENYEFHINSSGQIFWWWQWATLTTSGPAVTPGQWHHIALTYRSGEQVIYIDGVERARSAVNGSLILNNDPLQIGQDQNYPGRFFDGLIDEVRIYENFLSRAQVIQIMNETHPCSATTACDTFADDFAGGNNNNTGSQNFLGAWNFRNTSRQGIGFARISGGVLELQGNNRADNNLRDPYDYDNNWAERDLDLSGYNTATLTFDFTAVGPTEVEDEAILEISNDNGASFTTLRVFNGYTTTTTENVSLDISSFISNTNPVRIRFRIQEDFNNNGCCFGANNEWIEIDNLQIEACTNNPVDHYRLSFSSPVVTCERANITVTAEDASNNAILIPAGTTLTMSTDIANDGWTNPAGAASASYTLPADANSVIFQLAKLTPATLEIDVIDNNGSTEIRTPDSDFIDFVDAAFRFYGDGTVDNIGDQIAGKPSDIAPNNQTVTIRAIQTDPATGRCEALLSPGTVNIGLAYQCTNPASCAIASGGMNINGSTAINDVNSGYTPVPITFDATGTGTLNLNYFDVGQIQLAAQAALPVGSSGNVTLTGSSNPFIVSPFGFDIAVNGDPYADDGNDPVYTTAGAPFQTTIRSVLWQDSDDQNRDGIPDPFVDTDGDGIPDSGGDLSDNGVTPNIAAIAGSIALSPTAQVVTNNNGTLGVNSINFSSFDAPGNPGAGTYTFNQSWSEVGILQLDALSANFMGSGRDVSGRRINIGRFRPDNFLLTINPIAAQCGTFTYGGFNDGVNPGLNKQGQLFTLSGTITARNAANVTTNNYQGAFAKLQSGDINAQAFNVTAGANASGTLNFTSAPLNFAGGSSAFSDAASHYQFDTLAGAFDLRADLTATDSDGTNSGVVNSNSVNMRLGRLRLLDAYGPEFVDLEMRLQAEYFDGANWVLNSADSCSVYIDSDVGFVAGSYTDQLNPGETNIFAPNLQQNLLNGISALGNGLWFSSPGAGNFGSVQVEVNLGAQPWLQFDWTGDNAIDNATAGLHFGYYRGSDRVIYWQEIQN